MSLEWRDENGLHYLYVDYRGESPAEQLATLRQLGEIVVSHGPGLRVLIHIPPNHRPDSEFLAETKRGMRAGRDLPDIRMAFIGATGLGFAILRGLALVGGSTGAPPFPTREKALAYLAQGTT